MKINSLKDFTESLTVRQIENIISNMTAEQSKYFIELLREPAPKTYTVECITARNITEKK